ncbi:MAG: hypothetical protein R3B72_38715 [Polyangiaceae bacterium]
MTTTAIRLRAVALVLVASCTTTPPPEVAPPIPLPAVTATPVPTAEALDLPCPRGSDRRAQAEAAIAELDAALGAGADPGASLTALLAIGCFPEAERHLSLDPLDDLATLRDWWERGGHRWLAHYLALETGGPAVVPPGPRPPLALEPSLEHLRCPTSEPACAPAPWRARAQETFARAADQDVQQIVASRKGGDCVSILDDWPEEDRYAAWYACVDQSTPRVPLLPATELAAPASGWLIVEGRRGHHSFCDEIRAYDLATGAAYLAQHCHSIVQPPPGKERPELTGRAGKVDVDALREATWAILFAPHLEREGVPQAVEVAIPSVLRPGFSQQRRLYRYVARAPRSSGDTTLHWRHQRNGEVVARGTLRWPEDRKSAAGEHAVERLKAADASMNDDCSPAPLVAMPAEASEHFSPERRRALRHQLAALARHRRPCR